MTWVATVAGVALVLIVLREVFHALFHPGGQGKFSMLVFRAVWAASGRLGESARALAGPISLVLVIGFWVTGLLVGWALVYWPSMPEAFIFASPLHPGDQDGFGDALYLSWVTQATLGYGDIAPRTGIMRMVAPLQATIGFALFTAAVTWVLSLYPALTRRRSAAAMAHAMREADTRSGVGIAEMDPTTLARRMERMSDALATLRIDVIQYPSTVYFAAPAPSLSLAAVLPYVSGLARANGDRWEVRPAAEELAAALEEFAVALDRQFLHVGGDTEAILRAYRRHHGVPDEHGDRG